MISKELVLRDYDTFKAKAEYYFENNKFERCLKTIETAAFIAYNFNFFYFDDKLDDIIKEIGGKCLSDFTGNRLINERVVFYDSFGWDNRGLTQQYLRALLATNTQITYILESDGNLSNSKAILKELNNSKNASVFIVSDKLSRLEKIKHIGKIVQDVSPAKIFTHKNPWNTVGNAVFSNISDIDIFHINLTDHAFWLGKNAANHFLEFRNYGANISLSHRLIPDEHIFILPYYPIFNNIPFKGFPKNTGNKIKLFTGANFYKMYGDNGKFFDLIKHILNEHEQTILFIAGSGYMEPINKFISINNFEERVILLGDRNDINEVFNNIDIYIPTYPYTGGLMVQFAALCNKPIVAYTSKKIPCNIVEEFIDIRDHQITFFEEEPFYKELGKLVNSTQYRKEISLKMNGTVASPMEFNNNFTEIVTKKKLLLPKSYYNIDTEVFAQIYLESENMYLHSYDSFIFAYFRAVGFDIELRYYSSVVRYLSNFISKRINTFMMRFKINI